MQSYKIEMKESQLPVLLTKSILYNLIHRIGNHRRLESRIEAEALLEIPYIKYRKHEIIRIYESSIIFDTIAPNQGGIAYE